jgi:hypothetical protein
MILFRKSTTTLGLVAICWEALFIVLYFSTLLGRMNQGMANVIMDGAAICGIVSALTCYFPLFLKSRFHWTGERQSIPVAISFVLPFFGLGIC